MNVSYHALTPSRGNETFLLRFRTDDTDGDDCLLVDAGAGASVADHLGPADRLRGVLLTHAHADHYQSLSSVLPPDTPVYTSPDTARIAEDVFRTAADEGASVSDRMQDAVTPVVDWTPVADSVSVRPVPAGHAPGACGFLVRFVDGDEDRHLLVTGDFTQRPAAGNPGFESDLLVNVDALVLTASTESSFEAELTAGLATAIESANAGRTTLATASGMNGVQIVALLDALRDRLDLPVPVRAVGQVAKLLDTLSYDLNVELVPKFADPTETLEPGTITVAGPEIPETGKSSGRLFEAIGDDPNAALVQFTGGSRNAVTGAGCAVHQHTVRNHPTRETIVEVGQALAPTTVVVSHVSPREARTFNDEFEGYVWAVDDTARYELFEDGLWRAPPWITGASDKPGGSRLTPILGDDDGLLPSIERAGEVDLAAEGVDLEEIRRRVRPTTPPSEPATSDAPAALTETNETPSPAEATTPAPSDDARERTASTGPVAPKSGSTATGVDRADATTTDTPPTRTMTDDEADEPDEPDEPDEERPTRIRPGTRYDVVGPNLSEMSDTPAFQGLESTAQLEDPEPSNHIDARARDQLSSSHSEPATGGDPVVENDPAPPTDGDARASGEEQASGGVPTDAASDSSSDASEAGQNDAPESTTTTTGTEVDPGSGRAQPDSSAAIPEADGFSDVDKAGGTAEADDAGSDAAATVTVSPAVRVLTLRAAADEDIPVGEFVASAVEALLGDILAGDADSVGSPHADNEITVETGPVVGKLLESVCADEGVTAGDLLLDALGDHLATDLTRGDLPMAGLDDRRSLLERLVENPDYGVDTVGAFVQIALERRLGVR